MDILEKMAKPQAEKNRARLAEIKLKEQQAAAQAAEALKKAEAEKAAKIKKTEAAKKAKE